MGLNAVLAAGGGILDRCSGRVVSVGLKNVFIETAQGQKIGVPYKQLLLPKTNFFEVVVKRTIQRGDKAEGWVSRRLDQLPKYSDFSIHRP